MKSTLNPPPERTMPPGHHARRRTELLAITATPHRRTRSRRAVPLFAAASVAVVTAGVVAVPALRESSRPQPAAPDGPAAPVSKAARKPAPPVHDLTPAELAAFRQDCERSDFAQPEWYAGFTTIGGIKFVDEHRRGLPAAWLVVRRGAQHTICIKDGRGTVIGHAAFGPDTVKDTGYLYAPVDVRGQGVGPYTGPVSRVTVQSKDGPEQYAVLRHGFWFATYDDQRYYTWGKTGPKEDSGLIGVPYGYTFRGYHRNGQLVYDSGKHGPAVKDCYTDPEGRAVIVRNGVKDPTPAKCRRTLHWLHPGTPR